MKKGKYIPKEGDRITFINNSDEYPTLKGAKYNGRIDGFWEKFGDGITERVLYCSFWDRGNHCIVKAKDITFLEYHEGVIL
jgi:hypothetical protein